MRTKEDPRQKIECDPIRLLRKLSLMLSLKKETHLKKKKKIKIADHKIKAIAYIRYLFRSNT